VRAHKPLIRPIGWYPDDAWPGAWHTSLPDAGLLRAEGEAMMTEPITITDPVELEWRLIYAMIVAGKSAVFANACVRRLRGLISDPPLETIKSLTPSELVESLRDARTGNYHKLRRGLREAAAAELDLLTCGPKDLEAIYGIGPKTARFFILWTRPHARYAALDVHVLRWMRDRGHAAPASTPSSSTIYRQLELAFIAEADRRGLTPRELDLQIWSAGSSAPNTVKP